VPELTDDRLLDDLRRYGAAVEDLASRFGTPVTAYPGSPPADVPEPVVSRTSRPPSRRRPLVLVAAAAVLALVVATVVLVRRSEEQSPVVDTPPSVAPASPDGPPRTLGTVPASDDVPAASPFEDGTVLMWLPYVGQPQYLGQKADRPVSLDVGDAQRAGCCDGIATMATLAGFIADGRLHTVDRTGVVVDTGVRGDQVVADAWFGAFYVVSGRDIVRYAVSLPAGVDGQWTLPDGWEVPTHSSHSEVLDGRVILQRIDRTRPYREIAVWTPATGELRTIGTARWVVDATTFPDGAPKVAWVTADCAADGVGCGVVITDLDTMEERTAGPSAGGLIGGGAFSQDGRLALFVGGLDQVADLAVLDLATMELRVLPGTTVPVGESFGSAAWTLDNRSVIYHGLGETRVIDVITGAQRTLPWDITYSMAAIP
jgi:hypothetical protein